MAYEYKRIKTKDDLKELMPLTAKLSLRNGGGYLIQSLN